MATTLRESLEILKLQRSILKDGGYGRSVRTPWKEERLFRDSITCLHTGETVRQKPCDECVLSNLVPPEYRNEEYPCHFVPLNERGDTLHSLEEAGEQETAERLVLDWLNSTIERLEQDLAKQQAADEEETNKS